MTKAKGERVVRAVIGTRATWAVEVASLGTGGLLGLLAGRWVGLAPFVVLVVLAAAVLVAGWCWCFFETGMDVARALDDEREGDGAGSAGSK